MITTQVRVSEGDIDHEIFDIALAAETIGCDIETTGLDWASDEIGTFQLAVGNHVVVVRPRGSRPELLSELLRRPEVSKVFHHAVFDLRFVRAQWGVVPRSVKCTKIAAKIMRPGHDAEDYSLRSLLSTELGVHIDKSERLSDWTSTLSADQVMYAANDVVHLAQLWRRLLSTSPSREKRDLLDRSLEYLATRVELDLVGSGDVFAY